MIEVEEDEPPVRAPFAKRVSELESAMDSVIGTLDDLSKELDFLRDRTDTLRTTVGDLRLQSVTKGSDAMARKLILLERAIQDLAARSN